jgi:hypothetical protein
LRNIATDVHTVWERQTFTSSPAISKSLDTALQISNLRKEEIDLFDFYSFVSPTFFESEKTIKLTSSKKLLPHRPQTRPPPPQSPLHHPSNPPRWPNLLRRSREQLQHARPDKNDPPTAQLQERKQDHHRPHPRQRRSADLSACRLPLF